MTGTHPPTTREVDIDRCASSAAGALLRIIEDPEAPAALVQRACATLLGHVRAERNREAAVARHADRHPPQTGSGSDDGSINLSDFSNGQYYALLREIDRIRDLGPDHFDSPANSHAAVNDDASSDSNDQDLHELDLNLNSDAEVEAALDLNAPVDPRADLEPGRPRPGRSHCASP